MQFDWQNITALCLVAAALAYVVRRVWPGKSKKPQCSSCTGCGAGMPRQQLVSLEPPAKRPAHKAGMTKPS